MEDDTGSDWVLPSERCQPYCHVSLKSTTLTVVNPARLPENDLDLCNNSTERSNRGAVLSSLQAEANPDSLGDGNWQGESRGASKVSSEGRNNTQSLIVSLQEQLQQHSKLVKQLLEATQPILEAQLRSLDEGKDRAITLASTPRRDTSWTTVNSRTNPSAERTPSIRTGSVFHPWNQKDTSNPNIEAKQKPKSWQPRKAKKALDYVQGKVHSWLRESKQLRESDALGTPSENTATCMGCFEGVVRSPYFNALAMILIGLNALLIGIQADQQMEELRNSPGSAAGSLELLDKISHLFNIAFAVELVLRLAALRVRFIFTPDIRWNLLDVVLVASGIAELIGAATKQLTFARVVRILRLVRVLRVLRMVRFFDSLRKMVSALLNSLLSLFWLVVLLFIVLFVFAVGFMQAIQQHLGGYREETASEEERKQYEHFMSFHGNVLRSMLSLLQTLSNSAGWHEVMGPVMDISWVYVAAALFFVFFTMFGVMNVVTGIFVDRALYISQVDRDVIIREEMDKANTYVQELKEVFLKCDRDSDGTLTRQELRDALKQPNVQATFRILQLDVSEMGQLEQICDLLDPDGEDNISIDDFVQACLRLKGVASSLDLCALLLEVSALRDLTDTMKAEVADQLDMILQRLEDMKPRSQPDLNRTGTSMSVRRRQGRPRLPILGMAATIKLSM